MSRITHRQAIYAAGFGTLTLVIGLAAVLHGSNLANQAAVIPVTHIANVAPAVSPEEERAAISSAKSLSTAFRVAAEKVLPAVVAIESSPKAVAMRGEGNLREQPNPFGDKNPFEGTPFEDFFRDRGRQFQMPPTQPQPRSAGMGSGVIIDTSGTILTNNHVVAGDMDVTVRLHDGREFKSVGVWTDPKTDIAVVKIEAKDLVAAKLGDSDLVSIGDWVLALGQPFGLESTVTAGIISAKHRGIGITARESFLQTDAAINPGNSGGPLVNLDGELVGINTAISSRGGGNVGIGFAVPINLAKWVGEQLAQDGTVRRAYLGVGIQPVTAKLADQFKVKPREGVVVTDTFPNTPAAKAGLQTGDVIVEYAGVKIHSPQELQVVVERSELGRPHVLTVVRDGKRMNLTFTPEPQPTEFGVAERPVTNDPVNPPSSKLEALGLEGSTLDNAVAERLGMKGVAGVVITAVHSGGPAERAGLESGMVITQVNRTPVTNVEELNQVLAREKGEDGWLLLVRSSAGSRFVVVK